MINKRLLNEMPQAKTDIFKTVLMQWISLLCNIAFVFSIAFLIDQVLHQTIRVSSLWLVIVISIICIAMRMLATNRSTYYIHKASSGIKDHLRNRMFDKLIEMGSAYQEHLSTSELVQLNVEGIDQLETYFGRYMPQFFYSMLAPLTLFLILVWLDWKSAVVLLICVPLIPLSIIAVQKLAKRLLSKYWTSYANLGDSFLENLQGLTTLKIYKADAYRNQKMNEEAENFRKITMRVLTMQLNSVSVMDFIAYGGAAVGSIVAISGFINGSVSLFAVLCIILLSSEFFIPLRILGSFFHIAMNGIAASDKIFKILDMPSDTQGQEMLSDDALSVTMEHVNFSYDQSRQILFDISLEIQPQEFIGIIGESGSGKSTIAKLMSGFHKDYEGSVQIQGKQRKEIKDTSFYQRAAYITHQPMILKGSVRENLLIGKANANEEEMWNTLKRVRLDGFLQEQGGLDMQLLEKGNNLSGGQKQRLALARALLADRELYIFDEATSNIDVESEEAILVVLKQLVKEKKTVVLITHRLASITACDRVYVMEQGHCIEQGSHEALYQQQGKYYAMFEKQRELEEWEGGSEHA